MNRHWDETMLQAEPPAPMAHDAGAMRRASDETPAGELHFRELISLLHRRSRLVLTIALFGAMLAFTAGLLMPPKYTAKALIAIDPQSSGAQPAAPSRDEAAVEMHVTMLSSRDHLEQVVGSLLDDPEVRTGAPTARRIETDGVADRMPRRPAAAQWLPGPSELAHRLKIWIGRSGNNDDETTLNIDQLERRLKINQEGRSRIIAVRYTSTDPETAAIVANRITELYVEGQSEQKRAYVSDELTRLDSRIAELKIDIERSGTAVQAAFMRQRTSAAKPANEAREADQQLQKLEREAVVKGQLYNTLLRRQQEMRDQETAATDAHVLSQATIPDRPSSPNPFLFIFPALIVFLICGSLLAVLLERLDRGLRSEREINEALGIPCIGLVPQIAELRGPRQYLPIDPFAPYAEAFRSIAATMQLASALHKPKVILITSSLPGEGKTTLAVSLAACVATLRQRVLLIDLDFKHPSTLGELDRNTEQGILDLLLNNGPPAEIIQPIPELGLDYLPMNRRSVDPLALLAGAEMPRLLHQLRSSYDCVIIDSPPVLGCTETRLLAALADEILFVVKWGSTRREFAQNALNLLRSPGSSPAEQLRSVSALITQVDLKKHARYGYGDAGEYFLNYEKYSSQSSGARPAIAFRGSNAGLFKSRFAGALSNRYRLATLRLRLFRLRISMSPPNVWSHIGRRHPKPGS